jgi:nucleotide-binding universal stress UspA family protein
MKIRDILVPVDFSPNSLRALDFATSLIDREGEIYLLHVIDSDFVERLSQEGFSDPEAATAQIRRKAEVQLQEILQSRPDPEPRMDSMVVVGRPFAEILRVAADLDFEMIVLGIHGRRQKDLEELLFGSTAEKVLRAARIPVVCVPDAIQKNAVGK